MVKLQLTPIPALKDNYIWCLQWGEQCLIVDPGDATPVLHFLKHRSLQLRAILLTHRHYDHTAGVTALLNYQQAPVYGASSIPSVTVPVLDQETIMIDQLEFTTIFVPGHTLEHVIYYASGLAFTGDTLFTAGCGRVFEGTHAQMYDSLHKIASLPDDTHIYCGHEYTENNLYFALAVEPDNKNIQNRLITTKQLREQELPTVPATLALEKQTNPFLRCTIPAVIESASQHCGYVLNNPIQVFGILREWKNSYHHQ